MRPKNDEERAVVRMHDSLSPVSLTQLNWIICQTEKNARQSYEGNKRKASVYDYYSIITTHKEWQVVRRMLCHATYCKRSGFVLEYVTEVSQRWIRIDADKKMHLHIFELQKGMCWYYRNQPYALGSELSLKPWSTDYNRSGRTYFSCADWEIYPIRRFTESIKAARLDKNLGRDDEIWMYCNRSLAERMYEGSERLSKKNVAKVSKGALRSLPVKFETLWKLGEKGMARAYISGDSWTRSRINGNWRSIILAKRHGYDIKDWGLYLDYLEDLRREGLDTHNPHYICPENLTDAHARLIDKRMAREARARAERDREQMFRDLATIEKNEKAYHKRMEAYLGLAFSNKHLDIKPLQSVMEFYEEAKHMHHCVYSNGYYKKPNTLILSAKDKDGKRVETIEVNLLGYNIVQSRAACNKSSERHDEILRLVNSNMDKIRNIRRAVA